MGGQLHAGQLRYHDFSKVRDATFARQFRQQQQLRGHDLFTQRSFVTSGMPSLSLSWSQTPILQQKRTFLAGAIASGLGDLRLKQLERVANQNQSNPTVQYEFMSELSKRYPEGAVEFFESSNGAVDERCAMVYFGALQRMGGYQQFRLLPLVERLSSSGQVHPLKIEALRELAAKGSKAGSRTGQATAAMSILAGGSGAVMGGEGAAAAAAGGGMWNAMGGSGRGADPRHPLHVQMHDGAGFRTQFFTFARHVVVAFIVVSAITAVLDEKGMGRAMGMNSKHVQEAEGSDVRFEDVKGVTEAKAELEEIVMYLKDPSKFTRLGGKLPRGLLLTGPPGTGKTLLAKAIAGEAGVPFFFASGSQFEEVYVGLGAKRVRELFEAAKKRAPAIIFIDEIDAVGGTRKLKDQSALKMTLNELLVQLDGFDENNGIIVIGATNFPEGLDEALLRPGRFDKHVSVPLPDVGGRKEILEMYAQKTKLDDDVDLNVLARGTTGFSGADLYNLMNQAALKASIDGLNAITMSVFEYAKDKIMMGAERKTAVITAKTAKCTAYHEAGHALVATLTDGASPIHKATIMPRGNSLGMVSMLPDGDQTSQSWKQMIAGMDVAMGGRVAEELIFGKENVTSGAYSDIAQATRTARAMVTKYGFSEEVGIVLHQGETGEQSASSATRDKIDDEVKQLTAEAYERATALLKKYSKEHKLLAETLLEYETLTGEEVRDIIKKRRKPKRPIINTSGGARGDGSVFETNAPKKKSMIPAIGKTVGSSRTEHADP